MSKKKFYVVWKGRAPGIYDSWEECQAQVNGVLGAHYKAFANRELAELAFRDRGALSRGVIADSLSVDAACSGNPGVLEYRIVETQTGKEIFRKSPIPSGTNNLGEFLAIVHALAMLKKEGRSIPVYSDSQTAIRWVRDKKVNSKLVRDRSTVEVWELVDRAEKWLGENDFDNELNWWDTPKWGQIRADFNRK